MPLGVLVTLSLFSYVSGEALTLLYTDTTPNGFNRSARGWNSFGIQANPSTTPSWTGFNQGNVTAQCDVLAEDVFQQAGYKYCSLDSGWSLNNGDEYGRILYDGSAFNMPEFADYLHQKGLLLGIYVLPGAFCSDGNKTILGTDIELKNTFNGNNDGFLRCDFDFGSPGVQEWHNSVVNLFAQWGVDMIKLDFVTPGSPDNNAHLVANNSGSVIAYHNAIARSGRQMRLDISWKLERNATYYDIWRTTSDSMRTDQDINNSNEDTFISWSTVQRAIENYRQYIVLQIPKNEPITIYPDMDNIFVGNEASISGVSDDQRRLIMTHWIGAAANLISGADLTNLDSLGQSLLTDKDGMRVADFTAQFPMQPRNPGSGETGPKQLQAWIAGPDPTTGKAIAILANYGADLGQGGFNTSMTGIQNVSISFHDLGLKEERYESLNVWDKSTSLVSDSLSAKLDEGQSVLLELTPA